MVHERRKKKSGPEIGYTKATILDAGLASSILSDNPHISKIEVFGSIAREGKGNDIDLLITCDTAFAVEWSQRVSIQGEKRLFSSRRAIREKVTLQLFGPAFEKKIRELQKTKRVKFDFIVTHDGWRENAVQLMQDFWGNLDREAILLVEK